MTPAQYRDRVRAQLDVMRTPAKDRIIFGLIEQLFPRGDPDHQVSGADFIAEAVNLLAAFHPDNLKFPEEKTPLEEAETHDHASEF